MLEDGARLGDVGERRGSAVVAILGELQSVLVGLDGIVEQLALGVGGAQIEVIECELGVQGEAGGGEVRGRGLGHFTGLGDGAANASPDVDLVVEVEGKFEVAFAGVGVRNREEVGLVIGVADGSDAGRGADGGRKRRRG